MVYAFTLDSSDYKREPSYYPACYVAYVGRHIGVLLLALATGMAKPGAGDDRFTSSHMGMDALLRFDLADDTS